MTLRMADGPVANLPAGLEAYAGYVNRSGIGVTYPQVVAKFPNALHLSITTDGHLANCADVEKGAMSDWTGYQYGYCSVSNVNALVAKFGRPEKLWTAHYDSRLGAHICSPACWPGLVTTADGTQWVDHGAAWDESLLADNFFASKPPQPIPPPTSTPIQGSTDMMHDVYIPTDANGDGSVICDGGANSDPGTSSVPLALPWASLIAVTKHVNNPGSDTPAYLPNYSIGAADRGGNVLLVVTGFLPKATALAHVAATQ